MQANTGLGINKFSFAGSLLSSRSLDCDTALWMLRNASQEEHQFVDGIRCKPIKTYWSPSNLKFTTTCNLAPSRIECRLHFSGLSKSFEIRDECGMFYYRILFVALAQNKTLARKIPDTSRKRNDLNPEYEAETLNPTILNPKLLVCGDRLSHKAGHFTSALVCFSSRV